MKRIALPAVLVLAAAAIIAALWFDLPGRLSGRHGVAGELRLYGNVDIRQVELAFRVGGRVAAMLPEEGDMVAVGARLATLDRRPFEDALRQAKAQAEAQAAALARARSGARPEEIAQARAAVAERQAALRNAQLAFERADRLAQSNVTSRASSDEARADRDGAQARLDSAQSALDLLLAGTRAEDLAAAEAMLAAAEATRDAAATALADTELMAPAAGTILTRITEPGAIVAAGLPVYLLSLDKPVWVRAFVAEPDLGRLHPGQEVAVLTDSRPERPYKAQVGFISPVAEFTPKSVQTPELRTDLVYRLRIIVQDADNGLRQGMPVTVVIRP